MKNRLRTIVSLVSICGILSTTVPVATALEAPTTADECYVMGNKTYRITEVVADETALGMPVSWDGVSPYLEPSAPAAERPVYHTGVYLA